MREKPPVPLWRWGLWWTILGAADVAFYVLLTPIWIGLDFEEPTDGGRELLGGKGLGLAEMTKLDLPVPRGFTITTVACRTFAQRGL